MLMWTELRGRGTLSGIAYSRGEGAIALELFEKADAEGDFLSSDQPNISVQLFCTTYSCFTR